MRSRFVIWSTWLFQQSPLYDLTLTGNKTTSVHDLNVGGSSKLRSAEVIIYRVQCSETSTTNGVWSKRRLVKTATSQNGDKPKRLQVQSKRINLLSSTMDPFSVLLTKFQLIQLCIFCSAVIS